MTKHSVPPVKGATFFKIQGHVSNVTPMLASQMDVQGAPLTAFNASNAWKDISLRMASARL